MQILRICLLRLSVNSFGSPSCFSYSSQEPTTTYALSAGLTISRALYIYYVGAQRERDEELFIRLPALPPTLPTQMVGFYVRQFMLLVGQ